MKKLLINAATGLISIIASPIITAWITGQPLTGLTKVRGLYQTFVQSSVPAWAFALVFLVALFGDPIFLVPSEPVQRCASIFRIACTKLSAKVACLGFSGPISFRKL